MKEDSTKDDDFDKKSADGKKDALKVFILAGQSNRQG